VPGDQPPRGLADLGQRSVLVAVVGLAAAGLVIFSAGHGLTFLQDEWSFVFFRCGGGAGAFLEPHNEHLVVIPAALYKALFATVGLEPYWPYRLLVIVAHLMCVVLLYLVARRSVGRLGATLVLLPFVFFGAAWEVVLWPFNVQWALSVGAFLGLLLLLDRRDTLSEIACAVLLAIAIASSSLGLTVAAGVLVEVLGRPDRWRRIWIPVVPVALYGLWFLTDSPNHRGPRDFPPSPAYVFDAAAGAVGALLGVSIANRVPRVLVASVEVLTAAGMVLVVWLGMVRRRLSARLAMLLAVALTNWVALAITRSFLDPWQSRYVYGGAFLVALIGLELARERSLGRRAGALVAAAACVACLLNLGWLIRNADTRREHATRQAAVLSALELRRGTVDGSFRPRPEPPTEVLVSGLYFRAVDAFGESPAFDAEELAAAPEYARAAADRTLLRAVRPRLIPYVGDAKRFIDSAARRAPGAGSGQRCSAAAPRGSKPARLEATLPRVGLIIRSQPPGAAEVRVRRFASTFPAQGLRVVGGEPRYLSLPGDPSTRPWRVEVTSSGRTTTCRPPA
jgi:hypothetical protein